MTDYEGAYRDLRLRVTDLLRDRPDRAVEQIAPATPEWRVRDVVAHLGGVCNDIAHGNMDGVATPAWTGAQVAKRRDWPFAAVLDDWSEQAAVVEPMMNPVGSPMGQMVFDAWTHEQDMLGALGEPCVRDDVALDVAWEWFIDTNRSMDEVATGAMLVITEAGETLLGAGEPKTTLRTSRFEFLRAVTGRRSRAQIRRLDADGVDLDELLFISDFFSPAARDIVE